jgi:PDZ domain
LATLLIVNQGYAQLTGLELLNGKPEKKLKFRFVQGFLLVEIKYAKVFPLQFIFDTGAQNTIFFDKITADLGQVKYDREIKVMGADFKDVMMARIGRNAFIGFDNSLSVKKDIIVLDKDILQIQEIIGEPVHGILGADMLKGLVVHIDYKGSEITLYDGGKFKRDKLKKYTHINAHFYEGKPYIDGWVSIDGKDSIMLKLLVDTGASISLLLHNNTHPSLRLPDNAIRGNLGRGLSGDVTGFVSKTHSLSFQDFNFRSMMTFFQEYNYDMRDTTHVVKRNGIIGNFLLDRFSIFIDYLNNDIYFKPSKKYNKAFTYDRSGLVIFAHGLNLKDFIIADVLEKSPAYEAGLRPKDVIEKVGYISNENLTLERLNNILSGKPGKTITLKIRRNGVKMKIKFKLRELF